MYADVVLREGRLGVKLRMEEAVLYEGGAATACCFFSSATLLSLPLGTVGWLLLRLSDHQ